MSPQLGAVLVVAIGGLAWFLKSASRHGYESAAYEVVVDDGPMQVRRYAPHALVQTPMESRTDDGGSFRRLFRYIGGDNVRSEKIAMTTPVFMTGQTDSVPATMAFVVPGGAAGRSAPMASSPEVSVLVRDGDTVASMAFRGYRRAERIQEAERDLREWIRGRGLTPSGPARLAYYDPPWTPELLRRNEVQIPLEHALVEVTAVRQPVDAAIGGAAATQEAGASRR